MYFHTPFHQLPLLIGGGGSLMVSFNLCCASMLMFDEFKKDLEVVRQVGAGSFSTVYEVIYEQTRLAAKVLTARRGEGAKNQKLHDAILHEINMLSKLEHPNIVKLIGACSVGQNLCLCTEFSDIGSLASFIHVDKQMYSLGAVYRWGTEIAVALEFIHSKQILHRDLKSANVLIFTGDYALPGENAALNAGPTPAASMVTQNHTFANLHCKIADLGLASNWLQLPKGLAGTFRWMAPEVMRGKECSTASDIYAFGMLLYELGARETPFSFYQESPAVVFAVAGPSAARPPIPTDFPHILRGVIRGCWMQEASTRMDVVDAIELLKQGSNVCEVEAAVIAGVLPGGPPGGPNAGCSKPTTNTSASGYGSSGGAITNAALSTLSSGSGSYNISGDIAANEDDVQADVVAGAGAGAGAGADAGAGAGASANAGAGAGAAQVSDGTKTPPLPFSTPTRRSTSVADVFGVAPAAAAALIGMNNGSSTDGSGSGISRLSESIHSAHSFQETQQRWQTEILDKQKQLPIGDGDDVLLLGGGSIWDLADGFGLIQGRPISPLRSDDAASFVSRGSSCETVGGSFAADLLDPANATPTTGGIKISPRIPTAAIDVDVDSLLAAARLMIAESQHTLTYLPLKLALVKEYGADAFEVAKEGVQQLLLLADAAAGSSNVARPME